MEQDFWLAFDLLRSAKDHAEFTVVRESVRAALREVADDVRVDREKSVLKQAAVQHLYGRLSATLRPGCGDAELQVSPAQCRYHVCACATAALKDDGQHHTHELTCPGCALPPASEAGNYGEDQHFLSDWP